MNNKKLSSQQEQLIELFVNGPTWDGDLKSKPDARELAKSGYAQKYDGYTFITKAGIQWLEMQGLLDLAKRQRQARNPL